jgi:outer membrane protein assembly factor BamB
MLQRLRALHARLRLALGLSLAGVISASAGCHLADANAPNVARTASVIWQAPEQALGPPALDDSSAFFALRDNRIAAINRRTGAIRWAMPSGPDGYALTVQHSPVRAADVVVFGDEELFAYDAATGARRWTFSRSGADVPRSGIYPFKTDGVNIYAGSDIGAAIAIDAASGQQRWRTDLLPAATDEEVRVKAVGDGRVYVNLKYNGPFYSGRVYALDAATGTELWSYEFTPPTGLLNATWDAVLATDNTGRSVLAVSFYEGRIVGLDAQTGAVRWTIPRLSTVTTRDDPRWMTASEGVILATSTQPNLIAGYDVATGVQLWRTMSDQGSAADVPLTSDADLVYVCFWNGVLAAYDVATGQRRWLRTAPTGFFPDPPAISRDTLFLGGYDAAYAIRR